MNINGNWMNFAYMDNPTLYTSAYLVASPQGYTKHYYAGSERIASAIGLGGLVDIDSQLKLSTYHTSWKDKATSLNEMMTRTIRDCLGNDFNNKKNLNYLYSLTEAASDSMDRYFYHPDHLGSSSWITDGSGNAIQHLHYLPFGEDWVDQRNSSWNAPYTFSGKEKDAETGYGYFGARYYDSGLSIWLSVDPMSDKYPSMSPYNYCMNNPVIFVDPDGREFILGGDLVQAEEDIKSLVGPLYEDRITVDNETGMVSVNTDGLSDIEIKSNPGFYLIYLLVKSPKKSLYEVSDNPTVGISAYRMIDGIISEYKINAPKAIEQLSEHGIANLSKYGKDSRDTYTYLPRGEYDGQVVISKNYKYIVKYFGSDFENRTSIIFHELKENYYRTELGIDYKDKIVNGVISLGAHNRAARDEGNYFFNDDPGRVESIKISN